MLVGNMVTRHDPTLIVRGKRVRGRPHSPVVHVFAGLLDLAVGRVVVYLVGERDPLSLLTPVILTRGLAFVPLRVLSAELLAELDSWVAPHPSPPFLRLSQDAFTVRHVLDTALPTRLNHLLALIPPPLASGTSRGFNVPFLVGKEQGRDPDRGRHFWDGLTQARPRHSTGGGRTHPQCLGCLHGQGHGPDPLPLPPPQDCQPRVQAVRRSSRRGPALP